MVVICMADIFNFQQKCNVLGNKLKRFPLRKYPKKQNKSYSGSIENSSH